MKSISFYNQKFTLTLTIFLIHHHTSLVSKNTDHAHLFSLFPPPVCVNMYVCICIYIFICLYIIFLYVCRFFDSKSREEASWNLTLSHPSRVALHGWMIINNLVTCCFLFLVKLNINVVYIWYILLYILVRPSSKYTFPPCQRVLLVKSQTLYLSHVCIQIHF